LKEEITVAEYLTEQEQVEQLKKWLKIYGIPALLGVLAGIAIFYGWNGYQTHHLHTLTHASKIYDEMLTDRAQNNKEATLIQAQKLASHYPSTPYGEVAKLMSAQDAVNKKDYPEAIKQLSWIAKHANQATIRELARIRMARVYLTQQQPNEAIKILKKVDDKSFNALVNEVMGDAYLALNQIGEAKTAYQQALQELPDSEQIRPLLEMKLDNLAAAG
jgi:predicted negative regulator of RcsB-dependent stress response